MALDQFLTYEYVHRAADDLHGHSQAAAGALPRLPRRRGDDRNGTGMPPTCRATWTDEEAAEALRERARQAVVSQMMADVPLGAFLSGGIDSSTIVALMTRGARRSRSTASAWASTTAATTSCRLRARSRALFEHATSRAVWCRRTSTSLFDRLIVHLDEPFADVSLFPTFLRVAARARARQGGAHPATAATSCSAATTPTKRRRWRASSAWCGEALMPRARRRGRGAAADARRRRDCVNKVKRFIDGAGQRAAQIAGTTGG